MNVFRNKSQEYRQEVAEILMDRIREAHRIETDCSYENDLSHAISEMAVALDTILGHGNVLNPNDRK